MSARTIERYLAAQIYAAVALVIDRNANALPLLLKRQNAFPGCRRRIIELCYGLDTTQAVPAPQALRWAWPRDNCGEHS